MLALPAKPVVAESITKGFQTTVFFVAVDSVKSYSVCIRASGVTLCENEGPRRYKLWQHYGNNFGEIRNTWARLLEDCLCWWSQLVVSSTVSPACWLNTLGSFVFRGDISLCLNHK